MTHSGNPAPLFLSKPILLSKHVLPFFGLTEFFFLKRVLQVDSQQARHRCRKPQLQDFRYDSESLERPIAVEFHIGYSLGDFVHSVETTHIPGVSGQR